MRIKGKFYSFQIHVFYTKIFIKTNRYTRETYRSKLCIRVIIDPNKEVSLTWQMVSLPILKALLHRPLLQLLQYRSFIASAYRQSFAGYFEVFIGIGIHGSKGDNKRAVDPYKIRIR